MKVEIKDLARRIIDLTTKEPTSADVVQTTEKEPPYITHSSRVVGYSLDGKELRELVEIYKRRKTAAFDLLLEIERFVDSVDDSEIRQMIQGYYGDGLSWPEVMKAMGQKGDGSTARKKTLGYLQNT